MKTFLLGLFACVSLAFGAEKQLLLVAGKASHGYGEHKFLDNFELLAKCLNDSGLPLKATVVEGWPADEQVAQADSIFIISDGSGQHVAKGKIAQLRQHVAAGKGIGIMHYALESADREMATFFNDVLGGYFALGYSVNPIWTLKEPLLQDHAVTHGVTLGPVEDEWYFHIKFAQPVVPVLQAHPSLDLVSRDGSRSGNPIVRQALEQKVPQTLAWTRVTDSGARAFGFTGGHYHHNWAEQGYRTLVLNSMVWSTGLEVPAQGVRSAVGPITKYPHIDKAISAGDLADVLRHLAVNPASLETGMKADFPPLHQAIMRRKVQIAQALIQRGADVNKTDGSQRTPLHLAVDRGMPELVAALLAAKADPHKRDATGWTPLHHAAASNKVDVARALLQGGAKVSTLSERGGTALHEAAASGSAELIHLLLEAGVDPKVVSKEGVTALDVARRFQNAVAIEILTPLTGTGS